jgi:predicted metal-dependent HD superfamily phosphohydrolase
LNTSNELFGGINKLIKDEFINAIGAYTSEPDDAARLWQEIEKCYNRSDRHYHTLAHLENLLNELHPYRNSVNWHTIVFAIAYHDAVYNTLKSDNEEKSAGLAVKRLASTAFPESGRIQCQKLILATKKHEFADDETNLFTDADLAILGADPDVYKAYTEQIRREYKIYPDVVYKPGRKKVLQHFLEMSAIYKTEGFRGRYEERARGNLYREMRSLG